MKHRDLVYDVGMHKGEDAEFYLRKGFRVIGVEADPDLVRACRESLADFIAQGQLTIVAGAIVDPKRAESTVRFFKNSERSVWGTVFSTWADRNAKLGSASTGVIEVAAIDFCQVIRQYGMPYYLKIDIEGGDMLCIEALRSFADRPDYVSLESDKLRFSNTRHEIDALVDLGYDSFQAVEQSELHHTQSPPFPAGEGRYVPHQFQFGSSGLFGCELPGRWRSKREILARYRAIHLGYDLLGDDGIVKHWRFKGAWRLQALATRVIRRFTQAAVPGWYDTHARHSMTAPAAAGSGFES